MKYYGKISHDKDLITKKYMEDNALLPSDVVDNVTSTTTDAPLSANQGKTLNDRISNLANIGRFLAILDASAGTVSSQPAGEVGDTYQYKVGDYYRIGAAGTYTPKSTATFTIDSTSGSSNFETGSETYSIGDVIYCSNLTSTTSTWVRQASSGGGTVQDVQVNGTSILSSGIANLTSNNAPSISLSKVSDVTASATEVNVLDGITATTTELNYTDGVTSNIQTQLDTKVEDVKVDGTSVVTNKIANITLSTKQDVLTSENAGDNVTIEEGGGHDLPSGYTELEYIQSTGTQYIDTNIILDDESKVEVTYQLSDYTNDNAIFGSWDYNSSPRKTWNITSYSNKYYGGYNTVSELNWGYIDISKNTIIANVTNGVYTVYLNGTQQITGTADAVDNTLTCTLFARNLYSGVGEKGKLKIYKFKIWQDASLVREMYPAKRDSDSVLGMYDIENDVFYINVGTGTFTAGPEVTTVTKINALSGLTSTVSELNYCDGVTSNIQTQLDGKVETLSDLSVTASSTELNYSTGVTSNIQTQLNSKTQVIWRTY